MTRTKPSTVSVRLGCDVKDELKRRGNMGESYTDVIRRLLKEAKR